jgi:hypothetical protein
MSTIHLTPPEAQQKIAEMRIPLEEELVGGRHAPHPATEKAVKGIMEHTAQTEYDPHFDYEITEEMASLPAVRKPLEEFHDQLWEGEKDKPDYLPLPNARAAWQRHGEFIRDVKAKEIFLEHEKHELENLMVHASRHQGFPLSPDQIQARFRAVQIGYRHIMNHPDASGSYYADGNIAMVDLQQNGLNYIRFNARHELTHAASAQRYLDRPTDIGVGTLPVDVTRVGYEYQKEEVSTKRWMNEAMTEILATIFGDSRIYFVQFDHPTATIGQIANGVIPEILGINDTTTAEEDEHSYTDEKVAFLDAFADIPFSLLVNAYLLQDKDNPAGTAYGGAAAEKALWQEIRRHGGKERIKQLRAIEVAFEAEKPEEARALALKMKQANQSRRATLMRGVYGRQVTRNTQRVQAGIGNARAWLDKKKNKGADD